MKIHLRYIKNYNIFNLLKTNTIPSMREVTQDKILSSKNASLYQVFLQKENF